MMSVLRSFHILHANMTFWVSWTLVRWYQLPGCLGNGSMSLRPLYSISKNPSGMSTLGVPYSPMVPSLSRWHSGTCFFMANMMLLVPMMLFICV